MTWIAGVGFQVFSRVRTTPALLLLASVLVWPGLAPAQTVPSTIPPLTSPIERMQPPAQPEVAPPAEAPPEAVPEESGPSVHITGVEVDGATVYPAPEVASAFAEIDGHTVSPGQIADAVRALQTKYRGDGYFLTVVRSTLRLAPSGLILHVQVIEGYISDVKIDGDVGPVGVLIYNYLRHLPEKRPTKFADVERYVLLAKAIPGITIRTVLFPARDEPGAVELVAQVQRKSFDLLATDDNRGPRTAGPNEMLVGAGANSFSSLGERTEVFIFDTPFSDEQVFGQASYEGFIGSEGLKFRAYAGYGTSVPGNVLAITGYSGDLFLAGGALEYPVLLSRRLSLAVNAALDIDQSQIALLGSDGSLNPESKIKLRILRIGEKLQIQDELLGFGRSAADTVNFTVHHGVPELAGSSNDAAFTPRPGERNDFLKVTTEIVRVQNLFAWGASSVALKTAFSGQWTPAILPPSEKFLFGGEQYGRGFYNGEVTGDRAAAGTVEPQLNQTLEGKVFGHPYLVGVQYYTFFDIGQMWSNAPGDVNTHIESTGVGIRANLTAWLSAQVEGVRRFTRRPNAATGSDEPLDALFFRVSVHL
jgi:hemolysin activation/secretion protein